MRLLACICALALLAGCATAARSSGSPCLSVSAKRGTRILVFFRVEGPPYHASIPSGLAAVEALGRRYGFEVVETEDAATFNERGLRGYSAVVFLNTIGNVLDESQQAAFEGYIHRGGGFVGVHAAAHTEYDWEWYGRLVGAYFKRLTGPWPARVTRLSSEHLSTRCLPDVWRVSDEWYDFRAPPAADVEILATVDERSYQNGGMGDFHPVSWAHRFEGGRAWYTALGHRSEIYSDSLFLEHLAGGILWAAGK
jgi:type 1 glutamine amidotransferase